MTRVQGGEHAAQTPIQQQAFALRGWIDASIRQPRNKEEVALLKESIRRVTTAGVSLDGARAFDLTIVRHRQIDNAGIFVKLMCRLFALSVTCFCSPPPLGRWHGHMCPACRLHLF